MLEFLTGYVMGRQSADRAADLARSAGASSTAALTGELHDVETRIDRLLLVVEAMWSILRDDGYSDEQLISRIQELDESDGVLDGVKLTKPVPCPDCGAMVEVGRATCAFCGYAIPERDPISGI